MRKSKARAQERKRQYSKHRKRPQDKHLSRSWQKRNAARSVLQEQYTKAHATKVDDASS